MKRLIELIVLSVSLSSLACGGSVFGMEYDKAWYVRFKYPNGVFGPARIFDKNGKPCDTIDFVIPITNPEVLGMIDKLFNDQKKFEDNGVDDDGLVLDGLVFYNRNDLVIALIPNHFGYDLWNQENPNLPKLKDNLAFSETQMAQYDMIAKDAIYHSLHQKGIKSLPEIKSEQEAGASDGERAPN